MLAQVWTDVNVELPPDRWIGKIRVRVPGRGVRELDCLGFQRKHPVTGAENHFAYQYGTVDGKTGRWGTPIPTVTHWLKLVDRE
jgi:hypothetical protein